MRMDIANTMERITDEEDDDDQDRIIEQPLEESPNENRRMTDIKGLNIKAQIVEKDD